MAPLSTAAQLGRALILVSLLGACAGELGLDDQCTLIGCHSRATIYPGGSFSLEQVPKSHITVCRVQECYSSDLSTVARTAATAPYSGVILSPGGAAPFVEVQIQTPPPGFLSLTIFWQFTTGPGGGTPTDGDLFRVTLVDEAGTNLVNVEEMVNYAVSRPNGPDCEPTCHSAVIDKRV